MINYQHRQAIAEQAIANIEISDTTGDASFAVLAMVKAAAARCIDLGFSEDEITQEVSAGIQEITAKLAHI